MAIYTYVVDHGKDAPRVGLKSEVNGYPIKAVSFGDQLDKNEKARELLESVYVENCESRSKIEAALRLI
jgi:hypothetical protein